MSNCASRAQRVAYRDRTTAASKIDALSDQNIDNFEIPAFLRRDFDDDSFTRAARKLVDAITPPVIAQRLAVPAQDQRLLASGSPLPAWPRACASTTASSGLLPTRNWIPSSGPVEVIEPLPEGKPVTVAPPPKKEVDRVKYVCAGCGIKAWAASGVVLECGHCHQELADDSQTEPISVG